MKILKLFFSWLWTFPPKAEEKFEIRIKLHRLDMILAEPGVKLKPETTLKIASIRHTVDTLVKGPWLKGVTIWRITEQIDLLKTVLLADDAKHQLTPRQIRKIDYMCGETYNHLQNCLCLEHKRERLAA